MEEVIRQLQKAEKNPDKFLTEQKALHSLWRRLTATLYSAFVDESGKKPKLPVLAVDSSFDDEQVWQQLELIYADNGDIVGNVASVVARANNAQKVETAEDETDDEDFDDEELDGEGEEEDDEMMSEGDEDDEEEEEEEEEKPKTAKKRVRFSSQVDDRFFKLAESEEFADFEEKGDDNEDIDYFQEIPSDDEDDSAGNAKYADFFDPPENDPGRGQEEFQGEEEEVEEEGDGGGEEDEPEDPAGKSTLEMQEERLKQRISKLEEENLGEKPWQLKGESHASHRPVNALLEEFLGYDVIAKQAPVVTEEVSKTLEEVIKRRIKDKSWDDVERKQKPTRDPFEFKKQLVLDQEKSKLSLAEIYEKEYLKKRDGEGEGEGEEKPEHKEVRTKMAQLFRKLDALSNFHFAPRTVEPELKIVSNQPAITVEEVAPSAVSDAALMAPKEIQRQQRGELKAKDERTDTDKKRERRKKKQFQKEKFQREEQRKNPKEKPKVKLGGAVKTSLLDNQGAQSFKSSRKFFEQLSEIGQKRPLPGKKDKQGGKANVNVKRLKL